MTRRVLLVFLAIALFLPQASAGGPGPYYYNAGAGCVGADALEFERITLCKFARPGWASRVRIVIDDASPLPICWGLQFLDAQGQGNIVLKSGSGGTFTFPANAVSYVVWTSALEGVDCFLLYGLVAMPTAGTITLEYS